MAKSIRQVIDKQNQAKPENKSVNDLSNQLQQSMGMLVSHLDTQTDILKQINDNVKASNLIETGQLIEEKISLDNEEKLINDDDLLLDETLHIAKILEHIYAKITSLSNGMITVSESSEEKVERIHREERIVTALENLVKAQGADPEKYKEQESGLSGIFTGLGVAVGALIGIFNAQYKTFKLFFDMFTPKTIKSAFANFTKEINRILSEVKLIVLEKIHGFVDFMVATFERARKLFLDVLPQIKRVVSDLTKVITDVYHNIKSLFSGNLFGKAIEILESTLKFFARGIGEFAEYVKGIEFSKLISPFTEAFDEIKKLFSGAGVLDKLLNPIKQMFAHLDDFGNLIGKTTKIVGKLAYPLTIIMGVWDTVSGAIEGFEKEVDGNIVQKLLGGIFGAVKGLVNSVVVSFAEMVKDIVSFILDIFGFDSVSKILDSFDLEDVFSRAMDTIAKIFIHPIDTIVELFESIFGGFGDTISKNVESIMTSFANIGFDAITIPLPEIIGGDITIGPFKPFSALAPETKSSTETKSSKQIFDDRVEQRYQENIKGYSKKLQEDGGFQTSMRNDAREEIELEDKTNKIENIAKDNNIDISNGITAKISSGNIVDINGTPIDGAKFIERPTTETPVSNNSVNIEEYYSKYGNVMQPPTEANVVYNQSADNMESKENNMSTIGNTIVSAPTVNNSSNTVNQQSIRLPVRNQEPSSNRYIASRYAVQ